MKISLLSRKFLIFLLVLLETGIVSAAHSGTADSTSLLTRGLTLRDVIRTTLAQQPTIIISREQLVQSGGAVKLTRAEFDWTLESNLNHGADYLPTGAFPTGASTLYDRIFTTLYNIRLVKKTEYGFSLEPQIQLNRAVFDAVPGNGVSSETDTSLRVSFTLVVPILQGAGQTVVMAREAAARFDYEATRQEVLQTISQAVYDAIVAYWQYVAATERLQLAAAAGERAGSIVANTESLVHADEAPQAELVNAQANQLGKKISQENAELSMLEARQKLGLLMGAPPEESAGLLLPTDRLPIVGQKAAQSALANRQHLIGGAGRRGDLLSLVQKTKAAEMLVIAAKDALAPKLDLVSGVGYDGYQTGSPLQRTLQALENRQQYPDWAMGLRFSYPIENSQAQGNYAIAGSQLTQSRIKMRELQRVIEISLRTIVQTMQNVAREIETADHAVASYQQAVDNEKEKYLMGESTLFDLLFTQDKLEAAQLTRTDAYLSGALLLTRLQFESGSILACNGDACDLNPDAATVLNADQKEAK